MDTELSHRQDDENAEIDRIARNLRAWHAVECALLRARWDYAAARVELAATEHAAAITCDSRAALLAALRTIYRVHRAAGRTPAEVAAEGALRDEAQEAAWDSLALCEDHLVQLGWDVAP